jgi:N-acetylglucosamine malate deacetylase 2
MPVEEALTRRSVALVSAHPDDETVGAGGLLARMRDPIIVEVTGGAPRNLADARAAGYDSREEYGNARRQELLNALEACVPAYADEPASGADDRLSSSAGPLESRTPRANAGHKKRWPALGSADSFVVWLDVVDREASLDMAGIARRIAEIVRERRPAILLTHPYEGGHPDHDATAFAVHAACAITPAAPEIYEFPSYHAYTGRTEDPPRMETGRFLAGQEQGEVITLSLEARGRKARAMDCFATQLHMLRHFAVDVERFRTAPVYDFTQAPHPGKLFYEHFDWGMTGERWRVLAAEAARTLGIPGTL